jgi:ketosteroid isomerase-like protein
MERQELKGHEAEMNPGVAAMEVVLVGHAPPEIIALEAQIRAAQLAGDVEALNRLIDDDLLFTGPNGELGSKADDMEAHRSGFFRFRAHEPEELRIRQVGPDIAVAALRARLSVEVAGTLREGTYRYTRVWARENGHAWRVVAGHVSELQHPSDIPPTVTRR